MFVDIGKILCANIFSYDCENYCILINLIFINSRIKSGNPGFFVVVNPSNEAVHANFTTDVIGSEMDVYMLSNNFNTTQPKPKYMANDIDLPPQSTAIFTFVPK